MADRIEEKVFTDADIQGVSETRTGEEPRGRMYRLQVESGNLMDVLFSARAQGYQIGDCVQRMWSSMQGMLKLKHDQREETAYVISDTSRRSNLLSEASEGRMRKSKDLMDLLEWLEKIGRRPGLLWQRPMRGSAGKIDIVDKDNPSNVVGKITTAEEKDGSIIYTATVSIQASRSEELLPDQQINYQLWVLHKSDMKEEGTRTFSCHDIGFSPKDS